MMRFETSLREFLAEKHPAYDFEIRNGEYVLVSPHAHVGGEATKSWLRLLQRRVSLRSRRPDAPDVASLSSERLPMLPSVYALAVPERVIEVQSSTDLERAVRAKLAPLLE